MSTPSITPDQAPAPASRGPAARPVSRFLHRWVWVRLSLLLSAPLAWMLLVYVVALAALLITSLWSVDSLSSEIDRTWTLDNFRTLVENEVYRKVTVRTVGVALAVTLIDVVIALPIAFYMAKVASPRVRRMLVDPALRARRQREGRELVARRFSSARMRREYASVYRDVLERRIP